MGFEFYNDAFHELSTARQIGLGVGSIPFTAIVEYFRIYGTQTEEDLDEFLYVIRRMDNTFLELNSSDMKAKEKGKKSGATNPNAKNTNQG